MSEVEFSQYQDHISNLLNEFKECIQEYPNVGYNDRATQYATIRNKYTQLKLDLSEWNSTAATWPPSLRNKVRNYTDSIKTEVESLNISFNADVTEASRKELLGNSVTSTIDQEAAADSLINNANETKDLGIGILEELDRHRTKLVDISGKVTQLDTGLDRAGGILHEMQCRDRQRKYFLWGVNIFLFITLCVFIYYILK
ncbi:hypothetical protein TRFO_37927 [Tritrichomonas foetus]|uniref:t-SNARE coiled-coil homology domain-containing protein n=1 Tax=Tritrichomonas foetus TaxID=1144522 RepID=A0A1J4JCF1_9EUKA|nr:hypothetical protein TRFO_37927 [Tritrichomonas foetus]|eukprot:OHS95935.1 hypothetical protein TRFO_37927 [Tritrichomonas foetus]